VVITGGEALEHPAFAPLVKGLKAAGHRIEVETAGARIPPEARVDQWNVSLKLAHSGVAAEARLVARRHIGRVHRPTTCCQGERRATGGEGG
jgi:organic radical activating enzyme